MNNKGFTLVELIATIALLAIISVISFVSISAVIDKSKINECKGLVSNIKSAVKEYVSDNRYNKDFNVSNISVNALNISGDLINPFTDKKFDINDIKIQVTLNSDYTVKNVDVKNSLGNIVNCEEKKW